MRDRKESMYRFMLYNIRYAAGVGRKFHFPFPGSGYIKRTHTQFAAIRDFITSYNPDIVGLVEVDGGSVRSRKINQAHALAKDLDHFAVFQEKYSDVSMSRFCPIMRKQGNAILAREEMINQRYHYLPKGIKRLVIEIELDDVIVLLVHLSIRHRDRKMQLQMLSALITECQKPVILAGDFNIFKGRDELHALCAATKLINANRDNVQTYPSHNPRWELDVILHSPDIVINDLLVPQVVLSDHLPLICDFTITPRQET